jgi:dTDP-4-dehydrorhamnose 3,5-epimerase
VEIREMTIADAYEIVPQQHRDERGVFLEWYRVDLLQQARGYGLDLRQANCSVSVAGVLRGIHFAIVPPGQAKWVTCLSGAILDVVVDIRVGSPTFGRWEAARLDDVDRRAVYMAEGLGHAFMALTEEATVSYLCSEVYSPNREFGIDPFDSAIGIEWPNGLTPIVSAKDKAAPSLADARRSGLLPDYDACRRYYEALRSTSNARPSDSRHGGNAGRPTVRQPSWPSTE